MKKRLRLAILVTALLTASLLLSSCSLTDIFGQAGITSPVTGAVITKQPSGDVTTSAPVTVSDAPDLSKIDLTGYMTLDYKNVELTTSYLKKEITDEYITEEMETALVYYGYYTLEASEKTEKGQWVEIEYTGYMDGVAFDGGHSDKATILLDDDKSGYIPGFASGLIGATTGKELDVNVTFPEGYAASLAGKAAVFKITIHGVCKVTVSDESASKLSGGKVTKADELKAYFKEYLATMEDYEEFESVYQTLFSTLVEKADFKSLVTEQVDYYYSSMLSYYTSMAAYYNVTLEKMLASEGMTGTDDLRALAENYTKQDMVINYVANAEKIVLTDEMYKEFLQQTVDYWNSNGYNYSASEIESMYNSYYGEGYLKESAFNEKVADAVYGYATVKYVPETTAEETTAAAS